MCLKNNKNVLTYQKHGNNIKVSYQDTILNQEGGKALNKNKLESVMRLHGDTGGDLAEALGIARSTFSLKINEKSGAEFTQKEISMIKQRYSLTAEELDDIFFAAKVS